MKYLKPSSNVKYTIESWDGVKWIFEYECTFLTKLEEELELMKKSQPKKEFRAIRSEWIKSHTERVYRASVIG